METKRESALKVTKILRIALIVLIVLTMATWFLPYFTYPWADYGLSKGVKDTICLWEYFVMPTNFLQIEAKELMNVKFLNMGDINVCLIMVITFVISIIVCIRKKSIWVNLFPLIFSVYGFIGYFTNKFLLLGNHPFSRLITIVFLGITFVVAIVNIVFHIIEIKNRPEDYYLPAIDF